MIKALRQDKHTLCYFCSLAFLLSFTFISSFILSSPSILADEPADANVEVPVSCTISSSGINTHNANIANGLYEEGIGTTTLTAFCNDNSGFSIYVIGYTNDKYLGADHTKLPRLVGNMA